MIDIKKTLKIENKYLRIFLNILITFIFVLLASGIGWIFVKMGFKESTTVVIYLLFVFLSSLITKGYVYGLIGSIMAIFAYNFFFTIPIFSFRVDDPAYAIVFFVMAVTSSVTSILVSKLKKNKNIAIERSLETETLYKLTSHFTDAKDIDSIVSYSLDVISKTFNTLAAILRFDSSGNPMDKYLQQKENEQIYRSTLNKDKIKKQMRSLIKDYNETDEFYDYPLYASKRIIAVLRIPANDAKFFTDSQKKLLHSIIDTVAIAMDSFLLELEKEEKKQAMEKEQYRSNLLRSISHDLRTPLSEIIGTSEMLMELTKNEENLLELSSQIHDSAEWLHSLVENILNLTKIQNGKLVINKTVELIEEIAGVSASIIEKRYPGRIIDISLPKNPVFVEIDARLINQVLVNLLDNAVKHTKKDKKIWIDIKLTDDFKNVLISVNDEGTGIKEKDLPFIFESFYTTSNNKTVDSKRGVGLGLAICKSIVKAHGGEISCYNNDLGGATFTFNLLVKEEENGN